MNVPARAPQLVDVAYHAACGKVGRYPKRDRPQVVPAPITAPAEPVRISAPGESRPLMSDSSGNNAPPAAALVGTASGSPSGGPSVDADCTSGAPSGWTGRGESTSAPRGVSFAGVPGCGGGAKGGAGGPSN